MDEKSSVILFDGICNFCNSWVNFVLERDKHERFHFGALQSESGLALLARHELPANYLDSIVLIENEQVYANSDAILQILKGLSGMWPVLYSFIFIPRFVRDPVYFWIGRNRYRWFGKMDACRIPTEEERSRFI